MIRKYDLKQKINISKVLKIFKTLPTSSVGFIYGGEVSQYFSSDYFKLSELKSEILNSLPKNIAKHNLDIQIIQTIGSIYPHKDCIDKRFMLIPIKLSKNASLFEEDHEVMLKVNYLYTFNDFNFHGLNVLTYKSKCIFIGITNK